MNADSDRVDATVSSDWNSRLPASLVAVFVLLCAWVAANQVRPFMPGREWLAASLVVMSLVAAIAAFAPVLPWLNVLLAGGLAAFIGGMMEAVSAVSGFPFGRGEFMAGTGPMLLGLMPWWFPFVWAATALASRGTARLIFHGRRHHPLHGYRVIGLATLLAGAMTVSFEFYGQAIQLWIPNSAPARSLVTAIALHLFIQVAMTPLLIDKFPGRRPQNFLPLWVWAAAILLLAAGMILA